MPQQNETPFNNLKTRRSSRPADQGNEWIPAFAGMTANGHRMTFYESIKLENQQVLVYEVYLLSISIRKSNRKGGNVKVRIVLILVLMAFVATFSGVGHAQEES